MQYKLILVISCFASHLSLTVSAFNEFVFLVFTQLTCENILSTHADECGNIVKVTMKLESTSYFGLSSPSLIFLNLYQYSGMLSIEGSNSSAIRL